MDPIALGIHSDGDRSVPRLILPEMASRHGIVCGATGTGKTVALRLLAEQLNRPGLPVFVTDLLLDELPKKKRQQGMQRDGAEKEKAETPARRGGSELDRALSRMANSFGRQLGRELVWCKVLNAVISGPLSGQMQGAFAPA